MQNKQSILEQLLACTTRTAETLRVGVAGQITLPSSQAGRLLQLMLTEPSRGWTTDVLQEATGYKYASTHTALRRLQQRGLITVDPVCIVRDGKVYRSHRVTEAAVGYFDTEDIEP